MNHSINMKDLLRISMIRLANQYRRYQNKRDLKWTDRHLHTVRRDIAELRNTEQELQRQRMELKAEERSFNRA